MEKVRTNRKSTRGRNIYYQTVNKHIKNKKGEVIEIIPTDKVIKHIQASPKRLSVTPTMINIYDYLNRHTPSSNPKTIKKKAEKQRIGKLLWNSTKDGTYVRKLHGDLTK